MLLSEKQVSEILATMNKNRDAKTSEFTFLGSCVYDSVTYILLRANEETSEGKGEIPICIFIGKKFRVAICKKYRIM